MPGDIKFGRGKEGGDDDHDGKPKLHYAIQLALYVDALERLGFSAGRRAFVWDIRGYEVTYDFTDLLSGQDLWDDYESALADARSILARQTIPLPAYGSVCKLCHWHTFCLGELTAADDLTLIADLRRSEPRHHARPDPIDSRLCGYQSRGVHKGQEDRVFRHRS